MPRKDLYSQNPEQYRKEMKEYYWANRESILANAKKRRESEKLLSPEERAIRTKKKTSYTKRYREQNPAIYLDRHLKNKYGLTKEWYARQINKQGGTCAICKTDKPGVKRWKWFAVDHCHKTGKVRGLLCNACNLMIGNIENGNISTQMISGYLQETM